MEHKNFYQFKAADNSELGFLMGKKFAPKIQSIISEAKKNQDWDRRIAKAREYLGINQKYFPNFIGELKGYAEGAGVDFFDLWQRNF